MTNNCTPKTSDVSAVEGSTVDPIGSRKTPNAYTTPKSTPLVRKHATTTTHP
jgi:hypothetical protein